MFPIVWPGFGINLVDLSLSLPIADANDTEIPIVNEITGSRGPPRGGGGKAEGRERKEREEKL